MEGNKWQSDTINGEPMMLRVGPGGEGIEAREMSTWEHFVWWLKHKI